MSQSQKKLYARCVAARLYYKNQDKSSFFNYCTSVNCAFSQFGPHVCPYVIPLSCVCIDGALQGHI